MEYVVVERIPKTVGAAYSVVVNVVNVVIATVAVAFALAFACELRPAVELLAGVWGALNRA